jgi:CheY-like chemotaxis protein
MSGNDTELFEELKSEIPKKGILLVEDDPRDLELALLAFSDPLIQEKCIVECAGDGKQAIERLVRRTYDIIFLDLKLPVMDGIEVLKYCKETMPKVPVVIVTAYPKGDLMKSALAYAPIMSHVGIVTKPLTAQIAIETLQKYRLLL